MTYRITLRERRQLAQKVKELDAEGRYREAMELYEKYLQIPEYREVA